MNIEVVSIYSRQIEDRPDLMPHIEAIQPFMEYTLNAAIQDLDRRLRTPESAAFHRIKNALVNELLPYVLESSLIAEGLQSPEYQQFLGEVNDYLEHGKVGIIRCPDGRLVGLAMGDPRVARIYGSLRGMPGVRMSTRMTEEPVPTPTDSDLKATIYNSLQNNGDARWLVELVGPHIDSAHPDHGCGAGAGLISQQGLPVDDDTMWDGGLGAYFREAQQTGVYRAFNHLAARAGGEGYTFDYTHDSHSQGIIVGLKKWAHVLQSDRSLRQNLEEMHAAGHIVMTELLADTMREEIVSVAQSLDPSYSPDNPKDLRDPYTFVSNAMLIGRTALEITQRYEREGFPFIPDEYLLAADNKFIRVLAYHLIRNCVYQVVGGIERGKHSLVHHPERVLRAGPIGADFNVGTIPFVVGTPEVIGDNDVNNILALYGLMGRFLPQQGVDLSQEARVVTMTGGFNPGIYTSPNISNQELIRVKVRLWENAARIRQRLDMALREGYAVVVPMIHDITNRRVILPPEESI